MGLEWNLRWLISTDVHTHAHTCACIWWFTSCCCMLLKSQTCIRPMLSFVYMVLVFYIFDTTCYMILHSKHPSSFHCCGLLIHALNLFGPCTAKAKSIGPLDADLPSVEIQLGRRQAVDGCGCLVSWSVFFKTS